MEVFNIDFTSGMSIY